MRITKLKKVTLWMVIIFLFSAVLLAIIRSHKIDAGKDKSAASVSQTPESEKAPSYLFVNKYINAEMKKSLVHRKIK